WPRSHGCRQSTLEITERHAQRQRRTFSPKFTRKARRLLGPLRYCHWSRTETSSMRFTEENGARSFRTVHYPPAKGSRLCAHGAQRKKNDRTSDAGSVGYSRRGYQRSSGFAQSRADPASAVDPGV